MNKLLGSDLDNDKILDFTGVATTNEIINVNSYYSFGMVMQNGNFANNTTTPDTKYQYNNKEFNGDLPVLTKCMEGLNLLDYSLSLWTKSVGRARWYDPAVGRFTGVDPLAEKYLHLNPYNYTMNNPILYVDPKGMDNIIYLLALEGSEKYANANKVAKQANENFSSLGLKTTVRVISDVSKFDPEKLDKTDGVAVLGSSKDQVSSYINDNLSSITSESFRNETLVDWQNTSNNPEVSENNTGSTGGNVIAINGADLKATGKAFMEPNNNSVGGYLITHGAGHLSGVNHGEGGNIMMPGNVTQAFIQGANGNPLYSKNYSPSCPTCLSDMATDPDPRYQNAMRSRFGNNKPKAKQ